MKPKFSVIIPVYNVSRFLEKCIQSVQGQTCQDFEVILVDDGSMDDSGEICDRYAETDHRIKVIHKENGGLSDARNAGIQEAKGEYYYFLDSDDYIADDLLEKALQKLEEKNADMVVFGYKKVLEAGEVTDSVSFLQKDFGLKTEKEKYYYYVHVLLQYYQGWEAWDRVYKGDIIRNAGLRFTDNSRIFAEDLLFLMMYLLHAESIVSLEGQFYYYVTREQSIMDVKSKKYNAKPIKALAECFYSYIENHTEGTLLKRKYYQLTAILLYNEGSKKEAGIVEEGLGKIREEAFVRENIGALFQNAKKVCREFGVEYTEKLLGFCGRFYGDEWHYKPNICRRCYQKIIVRGIMPYLHYWKSTRNIFLIGSEDAGNLGDHQIAVSMQEFFHVYFPRYRVIELPASDYEYQLAKKAKYIRNRDWICLPGGGNLGDIYPYSESIRRNIIQRFPKNKIIIFPQTIYFSDTETGRLEKEKTITIYNRHAKLKLFTRDRESFQRAKEIFQGETALFPDIVLFSDYRQQTEDRNGILFCIRRDKESVLTEKDKKELERQAEYLKKDYKYIDHQYAYDIPVSKRKMYLDTIMEEYRKVGLVITDRLHGMIFAVITGTPCVVFDNYNRKVSGVYQWVKDLPYVQLCSNMEDIPQLIRKLYAMEDTRDIQLRAELKKEYDRMAEVIRK